MASEEAKGLAGKESTEQEGGPQVLRWMNPAREPYPKADGWYAYVKHPDELEIRFMSGGPPICVPHLIAGPFRFEELVLVDGRVVPGHQPEPVPCESCGGTGGRVETPGTGHFGAMAAGPTGSVTTCSKCHGHGWIKPRPTALGLESEP
jgi:hypothetical protein